MRAFLGLGIVSSLIACGGGNEPPPPDAAVQDFGFKKPLAAMKANMELAEDEWMEIGPADFTCLNTANTDVATSVAVALSTVVRDFQSDNLVPNAAITVFNQDTGATFDEKVAGQDASVVIDIPVGVKRFGYRMTDPESLDTLLLNQKVDPDNPAQTEGSIRTVSKATAATMPALIGISRTPGTGVLAGAMRDCQDREVSNFIAAVTVSSGVSVSGASGASHADVLSYVEGAKVSGADTYYFSSTVGLPVRHTQKSAGSEDGLFMVVELAPAPTAFIQIWGYVDEDARAADQLQLVGEFQTESVADTVITGSYEPLRQ